MKKYIDSIKKYVSKLNKYWVAIIFFIAITFVFGNYTIFHRIKYNNEISSLREEIKEYRDQNKANSDQIEALHNDNEVLEKYAREELLMVKPNEEVFIINE
ncbi:septum formation initiator family protein [Bacteroidales bacterium OttesenSCG-928-M11]|nr:septum formation initiator family protein [Bacteroidales bacterium OttesenSCG-928-M11]